MTKTLSLALDSRYLDTDLLQVVDVEKKVVYNSFVWGVWEPIVFDDDPEDRLHIVAEYELGRIDLLADRFYRNVNLWWVIAYKNNLVDPLYDMYVGQVLRVTNPTVVFSRLLNADTRTLIPDSEGTSG